MDSEISAGSTSDYLQDAVLESADVGQFLDRLCRHAARALSGGGEVMCGITLVRSRKPAAVGGSSAAARKLEEVQYNFDDLPCLTAAREQTTVVVPDLGDELRWAGFTAVIGGLGIRSVLAVPFDLGPGAGAGLNLYSAAPGRFTGEAVAKATAYAGYASRSLRLAVRVAGHSETAADLRAAMEHRTVIDIATGIIMCQSRCGRGEAIEFITQASMHRNVKLREVAGQIVAGAGFAAQPETFFEY